MIWFTVSGPYIQGTYIHFDSGSIANPRSIKLYMGYQILDGRSFKM